MITSNREGRFITYPRTTGKRFFVMNTAIAVNGTTAIPTEALQGSIGVTSHATGKSYWFVSDGVHWIANGGAVSSTAFADITGSPSNNVALAAALAAIVAEITFEDLAGNPTDNVALAAVLTTINDRLDALEAP